MIRFKDNNHPPILHLQQIYREARKKSQSSIDAITISSIDMQKLKPNSRIVNLKKIEKNQFIFYSNYIGKKSREFSENANVSCVIFWDTINMQIRISGKIRKQSKDKSNKHFNKRNKKKNLLAIMSNQSEKIYDFKEYEKKYLEFCHSNKNISLKRPSHWGGYVIRPDYFEFWTGNEHRLNKREVYEKKYNGWKKYFLEP